MSRLTSAAKAAALIIGVLIFGGVSNLAYSEQRPGDCGYWRAKGEDILRKIETARQAMAANQVPLSC